MNDKESLMKGIKWIDDNTIKGELSTKEAEEKIKEINGMTTKYMNYDPSPFGHIIVYRKPLEYRGIAFDLILCRDCDILGRGEKNALIKFMKQKKARFIHGRLGFEICCAMGRTRHCAMGRNHSITHKYTIWGCPDGSIFDVSGRTLRQRTEKLLKMIVTDIDWFMDNATDDFREAAEKEIMEIEKLRKKAIENER